MGKSSETFSKKEKEKKRLKKQQDKKERAEERKAGSSKGKSLEDMMAYVDAEGNITHIKPDLTRKKEIATDAIIIGVPKQEPVADDKHKGIVTMFNDQKGFGFIREDSNKESIFVHISGLIDAVKENDRVTFEITQGPKGLAAIKVKKG